MNTKTIIVFVLLSVANAAAAAPLPPNELHRLASYLSFITVSIDTTKPDGGSVFTVGSNCPECLGVGKVGDGATMLVCGWEDGSFYCNKGKIAKRSDGDAINPCEIGCAFCDELTEEEAEELTEDLEASGGFTEETKELSETIKNVPEDWNESTVRDLSCKLEDALQSLNQEQDDPDILCFNGSAWTFENKRVRQATDADMVKHLVEVHGLEYDSVSKYSRDELIAQHNLLHNSEIRASAPSSSCPSGSCPSGSCPSGSCPSSSSRSSSSSCPSGSCPSSGSRSSSSSQRRGLFGWRR